MIATLGTWQAAAAAAEQAPACVASGRPIPAMELTVSATSALRETRPAFTVKMPRDMSAAYVGFFDDQLPGPD